ncbi:MAG TPA: DUF5947 family protein [Acidimicrobiia bacterium]|nr:DUF5947 family protein [Acidimicrobiia bacterium]
MTGDADRDALAARVAAALDAVERSANPATLSRVRELVSVLLDLHGAAVERLVRAVEQAPRADDVLALPEVAAVLELHGVTPSGAVPVTIRRRPEVEACELCGAPLDDEHGHLFDRSEHALRCACRACALVMGAEGAGGERFRLVPDRYADATTPALAAAWEALGLPVGLVFVVDDSLRGEVVARYPGPAGVVESVLPLPGWSDVCAASPELSTLRPDVEAALARHRNGRLECFVVPVDVCFRLAGELREVWEGMHGGDAAWQAVDALFERCRGMAAPAGPAGAVAGRGGGR